MKEITRNDGLVLKVGVIYECTDGKQAQLYNTETGDENLIHGGLIRKEDVTSRWIMAIFDKNGRVSGSEIKILRVLPDKPKATKPFWDAVPSWHNYAYYANRSWITRPTRPIFKSGYVSNPAEDWLVIPKELAPDPFNGPSDQSVICRHECDTTDKAPVDMCENTKAIREFYDRFSLGKNKPCTGEKRICVNYKCNSWDGWFKLSELGVADAFYRLTKRLNTDDTSYLNIVICNN